MDRSRSPIDPAALWRARVDFLAGQHWTHALTLSWNEPLIRLDLIRSNLRAFHTLADRTLLGTGFHRKPDHCRTRFIAVVEGKESHPHAHLLLTPANNDWARLARMLEVGMWKRIAMKGSYRFRPADHIGGWVRYCLKEFRPADEWIDSREFLSSRAFAA